MKNICSFCNASYASRMEAINCYYSHGDKVIESLLKYETDLEITCQKAIEFYGIHNQIGKCVEELLELAVKLQKWQMQSNKISAKEIPEEIIDVIITTTQMSFIFSSPEQLDKLLMEKLQKLKYKMNDNGL